MLQRACMVTCSSSSHSLYSKRAFDVRMFMLAMHTQPHRRACMLYCVIVLDATHKDKRRRTQRGRPKGWGEKFEAVKANPHTGIAASHNRWHLGAASSMNMTRRARAARAAAALRTKHLVKDEVHIECFASHLLTVL